MSDSSALEYNALLLLAPCHERGILIPKPLCDADLRMAKVVPMLAVDAWHRWCELAQQFPNRPDPVGLLEAMEFGCRKDDPVSPEMAAVAIMMIKTLINAGMSGAIGGSYRTDDDREELRSAHWCAASNADGWIFDVVNLLDDTLVIGERRLPDVLVHLVPCKSWLALHPKSVDPGEPPQLTDDSLLAYRKSLGRVTEVKAREATSNYFKRPISDGRMWRRMQGLLDPALKIERGKHS